MGAGAVVAIILLVKLTKSGASNLRVIATGIVVTNQMLNVGEDNLPKAVTTL